MMLWNRSLRLKKSWVGQKHYTSFFTAELLTALKRLVSTQVHLRTEFSFAGAHPWNLCWEMSDASKFTFLTPICTPTMYWTPWGVDRVQWWTGARSLYFTSMAERYKDTMGPNERAQGEKVAFHKLDIYIYMSWDFFFLSNICRLS